MDPRTASLPPRQNDILPIGPFALHAGFWNGGNACQLLLVHGLGGNSITWDAVAPHLASHLGGRVVAVDLPGFGPTHPRGQPLSIARLLDILHAVIAHLDLGEHGPRTRWTVVGNSMGGLLGLRLAQTSPHRIAAVVLASPVLPLGWGRDAAELATLLRYIPVLMPRLGRTLVARYSVRTGLPGVVDDPVRALFADPSRLDPEIRERLIEVSRGRLTWVAEAARAYEQVTRSLAKDLLSSRMLRGISCPVQVIHGEKDPLVPIAALESLRRLYPHWSYVTLPDVGHVPQLEAPGIFASHTATWLAARVQSGLQ